jgi:hypothetical protein
MISADKFCKPIVILSAPRSGSTLLFEILSSAGELWTIGGESHSIIESIPSLTIKNNAHSNRLTQTNATVECVTELKSKFHSEMKGSSTKKTDVLKSQSCRFLEKTPKNSLRVPFLDAVFPDAIFIYLVRDPLETISSMMDAWQSGQWVTYRNLPGWEGSWPWSLLLPPGWQLLKNKPLEEVTAFQWISSNNHIIDDLKSIPRKRWTTISYTELVHDTENQITRLCEFCGIEYDSQLKEVTSGILPYSRLTLTPPKNDKWKKNEKELSRITPSLGATMKKIYGALTDSRNATAEWVVNIIGKEVGRHTPCPCGSGKKYKRCHGK